MYHITVGEGHRCEHEEEANGIGGGAECLTEANAELPPWSRGFPVSLFWEVYAEELLRGHTVILWWRSRLLFEWISNVCIP